MFLVQEPLAKTALFTKKYYTERDTMKKLFFTGLSIILKSTALGFIIALSFLFAIAIQGDNNARKKLNLILPQQIQFAISADNATAVARKINEIGKVEKGDFIYREKDGIAYVSSVVKEGGITTRIFYIKKGSIGPTFFRELYKYERTVKKGTPEWLMAAREYLDAD
jgi:hypothetical protein